MKFEFKTRMFFLFFRAFFIQIISSNAQTPPSEIFYKYGVLLQNIQHKPSDSEQSNSLLKTARTTGESFRMVAVVLLLFILATPQLRVSSAELVELQALQSGPTVAPLGCHRRLYTYRVTQTDMEGHECWDNVSVWSCWGRCDSSEISDWKFPYKLSFHPVCVHAQRQPTVAILKNCHPEASEHIRKYNYMEAINCHCQTCSTEDTSCEAPANNGMGEQKNVKMLALTGDDSQGLDY